MRVVLDTNVLVSAIVFGGPPGRLIELAAEGHLQLVLSPPLIGELREVPRRKSRSSSKTRKTTACWRQRSRVTLRLSFQATAICSTWGGSATYRSRVRESCSRGSCLAASHQGVLHLDCSARTLLGRPRNPGRPCRNKPQVAEYGSGSAHLAATRLAVVA